MINLDDKNAILKTQGGDKVLRSVDSLPQQLQQAFEEGEKINFPKDYQKTQNILVCGMGGSRFTPLIIKELFKEEIKVPYEINDDYLLPKYINQNSLVILSSYSGTTEEVLVCAKKALKRKAKITGLATGGEVIEFLKANGFPYYQFSPRYNPSAQPRIGFGYMVGGHLGFLLKLGFLKIDKNLITTAINNLSDFTTLFKIDNPFSTNPAKQLAQKLYQRYPYYLVAEFLRGVGNAIANQTNETAKAIASFRIIPELNHHLMEGLKFPQPHKKIALFIFFFSKFYSSPIQKRFYITKEVVEQNRIETFWYELKGKNKIEQTFELMALGSYTTMYLAALYNQDPSVIPYVDYFKRRLKDK